MLGIAIPLLLIVCFAIGFLYMRYGRKKDEIKDGNVNNQSFVQQIENEQWITRQISQWMNVYDDQLEGVDDPPEKAKELKAFWKSGQWSARMEIQNRGSIMQLPPFTLNFCFENDSVVGYGQQDCEEFLISGFFSPWNKKIAFKQEFMTTPGGDDEKIRYPIDFQLKWDEESNTFQGHFYLKCDDNAPINAIKTGVAVLYYNQDQNMDIGINELAKN